MKIIDLFQGELKFFDSIDNLPVKRWFKIQETNDVAYIVIPVFDKRGRLITKKINYSTAQKNILLIAFSKITRQYLDTFGISDSYRRILELRRDIEVNKNKLFFGDSSAQTMIDIYEFQLAEELKETENKSTEMATVYVEKHFKFSLDTDVVTVKKFYTYIDLIRREQTAQRHERQNKIE